MKSQELRDKLTKTFKSFSIDKTLQFVKKNLRYFAAGALLLALVLIVAKCTGEGNTQKETNGTEVVTETEMLEAYQIDAIPAVNELIQNYYTAYAAGDTKTVRKYAKPTTKKERSYIKMFSEYVEGYEDIQCYTKKGLDDTSYMVSVYLNIKFIDVETTAPGLDFFYIRTNDEGALYIDNLYSQFNLQNKEKELDEQVKKLMDLFELQKDVIELQAKVQNEFEIAITDEKLAEMINVTLADAYKVWAQAYADKQAAKDTEVATETETEPPVTEEPVTEEPVSEEPTPPAETNETVYALKNVNIRSQANESAELIETVSEGTALTRTGTTEDGWSKLNYNGAEAYVKSEFVSTEAPQVDNSSNAIAEGTKVMLSQSVNVRSSMGEDAEKIGTAFAGETVTIVMSYAEGWSKVSWNDKTGYIKTEFLK